MAACGQSIEGFDEEQYKLYISLVTEEVGELYTAQAANDKTEQLDALIDILVVTIGALHSFGADAEGAWREVIRSNFSKIDPVTGFVRRREDGKILKPIDFSPPQLAQFLNNHQEA